MTNWIKITSDFNLAAFSNKTIKEASKIALFNLSESARDDAFENAPYKSGTLRKSIGRKPNNITTRTKEVVIWPRRVPYAQRREYENFKNPDRKFYMKRAYTSTKKSSNKEFENALEIAFMRNKIKLK